MIDQPSTCEQCGADLPANAPQGLCPRCLLRVQLADLEPVVAPAGQAADPPTLQPPLPVEEKPGTLIGRYKLLEKIGEGGFGVVYVAEQRESVKRRVALKIIKLGMDTRQVVARFEAERQALALMDHPNIAKVLDAGATETGRPFFVMDLVRGVKITDYCDQNHLSTGQRLELFIQVCRAVQHAHQKGVIHRDLKPSNILVTLHDGLPTPKVIDFGIAKATQGRLTDSTVFTTSEQFIGTPAYMSPEQAEMNGLDIDTRSDIYSLGVLLYELLTSKTPFDAKQFLGAGLDAVRRAIREQEPPRPSTRLDAMLQDELTTTANRRRTLSAKLIHLLRGDLDWIVMKCLEKDRTRRYETANALAMDVQRHFNNEPVLARPPSKLHRFDRLVRRNKLAFAAALAVALALVAGVALSSWQAVRARRAEKVARENSATAEAERLRAERASEALRLSSYVSEMNLAGRYCDEQNFADAWRLLQSYQTSQDGNDLRGFEWRYLARLCRGNYSMALPKHAQVLGSLNFSPDGYLLATYCWNRTLRLWDLANNTQQPIFEAKNAAGPGAFSADGQHLVFGLLDGRIQLYDLATHHQTNALKAAGELAAFSAGGNLVATISRNRDLAALQNRASVAKDWTLKVMDLSSGRVRFALPSIQRRYLDFGWVEAIAMDFPGRTLAVVEAAEGSEALDHDLGIHLWDLSTMQDLGLLADNRQIRALAFSPNGRLLAVGDGEGGVRVWDLAARQFKTILAHTNPITALAFSPAVQQLATGSSDQTIKLWDLDTGLESTSRFRGGVGTVWSLAFSPDGRRLASGSRDTPVRIWNLGQPNTMDEIRHLHSKEYGNFAFSPDGRSMAAGCEDRTVKVWEVATLQPTAVLTGMQFVVAFSADSSHLLASTPSKVGYWWDLPTLSCHPLPGYTGNLEEVLAVDLSLDGTIAALGHADGMLQLLEIASGKTLWHFQAHDGPIRSLSFSPDGLTLASGGSDRFFKVWDVKRQTQLGGSEDQASHKGAVCAAVISHDGRRLASGCGAGTLKLWDPANLTNALITIACHKSALRTLDFSHDSATLVSGGEDKTVKLWNVQSLLSLPLPREVGSFTVSAGVRLVQFSPDDSTLAIVTDDGVLRLLRAVSKDAVPLSEAASK